jgi:phosphatidate cytidylyltransferase
MTAAILAPAAIAVILFLPKFYTASIFALFLSIATWEWTRLGAFSKPVSLVCLVMFCVLAGVVLGHLGNHRAALFVLVVTSSVWLLIALFIFYAQRTGQITLDGFFGRMLKSPVNCLILLLGALVGAATMLVEDRALLLLIFVTVWTADSGAYFAGKRWGRRKLASNISPGKSWEGVFGGIGCSTVVLLIATQFLVLSQAQALALVGSGIVAAGFSVIGDLFESLLKRNSGVKDSGNILPGHGGLLDRIDGLIAAIPIYSLGFLFWVSKL